MILGKKIGMTRVFNKTGKITPVTLISAGPCYVTQIKTKEKDGYCAIQIGFDKKKKISRALKNHINKAGKSLPNFRYFKELRIEESDLNKYKLGQEIKHDIFSEDENVMIVGISKGRGFAGGMKRHGFHGQSATHGHKHDLRKPGSIGAGGMQHVIKGRRMAGHMGVDRVTVKNLKIVKVDKENNLIAINGALPGARNGLVVIKNH